MSMGSHSTTLARGARLAPPLGFGARGLVSGTLHRGSSYVAVLTVHRHSRAQRTDTVARVPGVLDIFVTPPATRLAYHPDDHSVPPAPERYERT